ncbi:PQQ-dependent sugar dehydrogenase [Saliphagus sp. GCM10025308]
MKPNDNGRAPDNEQASDTARTTLERELRDGTSRRTWPSRRTFLRATATAGAVASLSGLTVAQEETTIELGGNTSGWEGRSPTDIEGETNPTLTLEAGQTYSITWENVDGLPHDIIILDADGNDIVGTEIMSEQGETQTLEFEATEEMAEYYCSVHPGTMRGDIQIGEPADGDDGEDTEEETTDVIGEGPTIGLERVADGFVSPVGFEVAPGQQNCYYVHDQPGQIYHVDSDSGEPTEFLDLSDRMVDVGAATDAGFDERGLLGLAFHPDYQENRRLFVYYSAPLREDSSDGGVEGESETGDDSSDEANETDSTTDENASDDNDSETDDDNGTDDANGTDEENGSEDSSEEDEAEESYDHTAVLAEFQATEDFASVDLDSERILIEVDEPQFNHNGGPVVFGPDGYLYWALGDGGGADDVGFGHLEDWYDENEGGNAQNTTETLLGGIHRIDVDNEGEDGKPYAIPDDNPFVDSEDGFDEYFAWGLRNPWRASFDGEGRLFVADVGQNLYEEVNIVENGGNYGWNVKEGIECFSTADPSQSPSECPSQTPDDVRGGEPLLDPVIHYPHQVGDETLGISITGGYVYEGEAAPALEGHYVFGDWSDAFERPSGALFASPLEEYEPMADRSEEDLWDINRLSVANAPENAINRFILSFGRDHDGELYVLTTARYTDGETGEVFRIVSEEDGEEIEPHEDSIAQEMGEGEEGNGEGEEGEGEEGDGEESETDDGESDAGNDTEQNEGTDDDNETANDNETDSNGGDGNDTA